MSDADELVYGRHAVAEALRAGRPFHRILLAGDPRDPALSVILDLARERGIPFQLADRKRLDAVCQAPHQGAVGMVAAHEYARFDDLLARAIRGERPPVFLLLDGIQDPRNLGAILRTAAATGVDGVVLPKRRSAGLTGAVAKASAGAVERVPVAQVANLNSAMESLRENRFWTVGLGSGFPDLYTEVDYRTPTALVIGGEAGGIRPIVQRACDHLVRIPMAPGSGSLNASVAAALVLYEAFRQRGWS
jgi:23S rRNA (guanosine2251-2'-O)-methyltransferase